MKSFFNFLLISCLILTTIYGYKLQSTKVSWATNCGSSQSFTGSDGVFYHAVKLNKKITKNPFFFVYNRTVDVQQARLQTIKRAESFQMLKFDIPRIR